MIEQKLEVMKNLSQSIQAYQQAVSYYHQTPTYETYQQAKNSWSVVSLHLEAMEETFEEVIA